jgi:hypothetical protein
MLPAAGCWRGLIALAVVVGSLSATSAYAQAAPAAPAAPAQAAQPATPKRLFQNDGGLVLHFIKPDKTADFEAVMAKLKEALQKSDKPERKQQAANWRLFKSPDPAGANVLYVFVIAPSVKDADYQVSSIIQEGFASAEANELLAKYSAAYSSPAMNVVNLNLIQDFGK